MYIVLLFHTISNLGALFIGLGVSFILNIPNEINKNEIEGSCVSFETTTINIKEFSYIIQKYISNVLNYRFLRKLDSNSVLLISNKLLSLDYVLLTYEGTKITILTFLRDGYYYEVLPQQKKIFSLIGENIFNLSRTSTITTIKQKFDECCKPHRIVTLIRSLKNIGMKDVTIILLIGLCFFLLSALFVFPEWFTNYNVILSYIPGVLIGIFITVVGGTIVLFISNKLK